MTVGRDCHLYLGSTGSTKRSGFVSDAGIFDFDALTVAAGGEVTPTHDLVGENNALHLAVSASYQLSSVMRKFASCTCEIKGIDQLHGNCEADQAV